MHQIEQRPVWLRLFRPVALKARPWSLKHMSKLKIFVADNQNIIAPSLKYIIGDQGDVVGSSTSTTDLITKCVQANTDILIMGLNFGSQMDGVEFIENEEWHGRFKIFVLSDYSSAHLINRLLDAGISAYVPKPSAEKEFKRALTIVKNKGVYIPNCLQSRQEERS